MCHQFRKGELVTAHQADGPHGVSHVAHPHALYSRVLPDQALKGSNRHFADGGTKANQRERAPMPEEMQSLPGSGHAPRSLHDQVCPAPMGDIPDDLRSLFDSGLMAVQDQRCAEPLTHLEPSWSASHNDDMLRPF